MTMTMTKTNAEKIQDVGQRVAEIFAPQLFPSEFQSILDTEGYVFSPCVGGARVPSPYEMLEEALGRIPSSEEYLEMGDAFSAHLLSLVRHEMATRYNGGL